MNEKMKKVGKKIGAALLTLAIVLFFRHVVLKDSREEEQKSYYISTINSYKSRRSTLVDSHREVLELKEKLKKEQKNSDEYNKTTELIKIKKRHLQSDMMFLQSYIREIRYYEKKFPELEPVKIENEKEILNGTYLDTDYYEEE